MYKFKNIPKIICISTTNASDRQNNFIHQCEAQSITNFSIEVFEPYRSANIEITGPYIDKIHENSKGPISSHLNAINNWLKSCSDEYLIIMEDDISFECSLYWNFTFSEFIESLPLDWECIQLSLIRESFDNISIKFRSRLNTDFGCQAYLMKRNYAEKLVNKYRLSDKRFHLDINNTLIQINPGEYYIYNLFPIVENVLFEGTGKVYNAPLFVEDIRNTQSNFTETIGSSNDNIHIQSYNKIVNWWQSNAETISLNDFLDIEYKDPITVVQIGAHHGNDQLSKHLLSNYKNLNFGLFVEANPLHIEKLKSCYSKFSNIIIENIAIKPSWCESDILEIFYHDKDPDKQVASYSLEHVKNHEKFWQDGAIQSFKIQSCYIEQLLDKYDLNLKQIDWFLIDAEGIETDIILNLNFDKYNIKRLEFEKLHLHHNKSKILAKLANEGYKKVASLHEYDWAFEKDTSSYDSINIFAKDTENAELNFELGYEYETLGHTASAFSHYLRCSERSDNNHLIYESLIRSYYCFNQQGNRDFTSSHILKQAISILPKRPEAYLLLVQFYFDHQQWYDCYTYCNIALDICNFDSHHTYRRTNIKYLNKDAFILYKAISGCYWDKIDEAKKLLNSLIDAPTSLPNEYWLIIESELIKIEQKKQLNLRYYKDKAKNLRIKFQDYEYITENYSQCFQDIFVLGATNGKRNGTYLEIGSGDPKFNNNTFLLETNYAWRGLSIDLNEDLVNKFKAERKNMVICEDATKIRYEQLLDNMDMGRDWDYLQLDCEPPSKTLEVLLALPLHKYRFGIITYEHDFYLDMTRSYKDKSRAYLNSLGYKLIVNDVSADDNTSFEDWWIHPELIDSKIYNVLLKNDINITNINNYIYQ